MAAVAVVNARYHIIEPALCGPLRSLCGIRRPSPSIGTKGLALHPSLLLCRECFGELTRRTVQLELFPLVDSGVSQ